MRSALLLIAALLLPHAASAEDFTTARDIRLPLLLQSPSPVTVELDSESRQQGGLPFRIINIGNMSVALVRLDDNENIMPRGSIAQFPPAADTVPGTTVDMLRDGDTSTAFQPAAAKTLTFLVRFPADVAPTSLEYVMAAGVVENVKVRSGRTTADLHEDFVGVPSGNAIQLSGETARVFEIIMTMRQGVPKIAELRMLQPRSRLLFRAVPGQRYRLLSGAPQRLVAPYDATLTDRGAVVATLGPARGTTAAEREDHDGIETNDNCPAMWNPEQEDGDADGIGDACDNCRTVINGDQLNADGDSEGDACEDDDRDSVINQEDNCPLLKNIGQQDEDNDGIGNACDNVDDRWTADRPWLLWGSFALMIVLLVVTGVVILTRKEH